MYFWLLLQIYPSDLKTGFLVQGHIWRPDTARVGYRTWYFLRVPTELRRYYRVPIHIKSFGTKFQYLRRI